MADTVAVMNKGEIEQMGSPEDLYELPKTAFVATFLGQSNLFTGDVTADDSRVIVVDIAGLKVSVPKPRAQRHTGKVTVGVRPEKLQLHTERVESSPERNVLGPGRVTDVSFTGVSTQYLVQIPGIGEVSVFSQNTSVGPVVHEGAEVWVSWHVEHGFGLLDEPEDQDRFESDFSTGVIAAQTKAELLEELEES